MLRTGRRSWRRCGSNSARGTSRWWATRDTVATWAVAAPTTSGSMRRRSPRTARYDGKWVLRTNTDLDSAEVALQYKQLSMVEQWFRSCKTLLQTRPIYHRCDETIRGHVFCSFLALVLRQELQSRLEERGHAFEWADVIADLDRLQRVEVEQEGKRFLLRSDVQGTCGKVFQTVGVAIPPTVQQASSTAPGGDAAHSATPPD